ncbi:Dual specificity tyrosine-phosphorylation-regulated kinase 3 [Orchesella cincta]|uniref:Dual specificity tyrosine-phosphorylation-regulated kinase 3 n=1 Tax=Orchesella cincta TaxID=48709 RepID=A0A1D2M7K9_ORCCI|nr:Dual specificity tyrosine-phosphorylation-regulated kinase 3 [Orchesella cincta]
MACILECLENSEGYLQKATRAKEFFSDKNNMIPAYCEEKTKKNGKKILVPKRKENGKIRGPPGTRDLELVLGMQGCQAGVFGFREKVLALGARSEVETFSGSSPSLDQEDEIKISDEEWRRWWRRWRGICGKCCGLEPKVVGWEN